MIYFDSTSIYRRALEKLQQNPDWKVVANNSVVSALLKSNSEIQAETARYAEYLFQESKWDTAQNASSILAMANMLGYQPKRKISARGTIWISADPRTHLVGKTISSYFFEDLADNGNTSSWNSLTENYSITSSCTITDNLGNSYIAIPKLFPSQTKIMELNIIQGKRKSAYIGIDSIRNTSTQSRFDPYLYIPVTIQNCEDASNSTSKAFFRVFVNYVDGTSREFRVVDTLLLSSSSDYDVEVYNDLYSQTLFYLKFNNDPSRGNTLDISRNSSIQSIRIDYIESLGEEGNVLNLFRTFTISDVPGADGLVSGVKLYGINLDPISGGKNEESVYEVKTNAPLNYINSYTAGTKEAYETAIENMDISINKTIQRPRKVQVYGSTEEDSFGNLLPITCISFIADGLEDIISGSTIIDSETGLTVDPYADIEKSLNYYLYRLKSPQDTLRFVPPNYVGFALGLKCRINKESTDDITQLAEDIRTFIDDRWGSNSDYSDFERNFYSSSLITDVMNNFEEIASISAEVEAVKKLDWGKAERKSPKPDSDNTSTIIHTIRIPFSFDSIFVGNLATEGFKDYRVGSDYVMRIDVMYKKPKSMSTQSNYHVTIFLADGRTQRQTRAESSPDHISEITDAFYFKKDTSQSGIWDNEFRNSSSDYNYLADVCNLTNSYQYYYRSEIYSDNDFRDLIDESSQEYTPTINSYLTSPGAIDDYLIYFSADYDTDDSTIADGWLEITFDPIYKMLSTFASYDADLSSLLSNCSLAMLKCTNTDISDSFTEFTDALSKYVDIYVSLRPIDPDLQINLDSVNGGSTVLYIDSYDSDSIANTINITTAKRERMISVSCEYED